MSADEYYERATYRVPVTVTDQNDDPVDLTEARIDYMLTDQRGGGETLLQYSDDDLEVQMTDAANGEFLVAIDADQITWTETVWEEIRISLPGSTKPIVQRDVQFDEAATDPPEW